MTTDIASIARGLTKAQREALTGDPNADMPSQVALDFIAMRLIKPCLKDPFAQDITHIQADDLCMGWTQKGLAVAAYLKDHPHD
jgi:hypothetical protein